MFVIYMDKFTSVMLNLARVIDAWRLIPRTMVGMYGFMIYKLFLWYTAIPTHEQISCSDNTLRTLIDSGMNTERAMDMACTIIDTVGGPTASQTSFVTVIIGLSSAIFAFYVNSGTGWERNASWNTTNNEGTFKRKTPTDQDSGKTRNAEIHE